jgi:phospholipid transport system substrate-binding protein
MRVDRVARTVLMALAGLVAHAPASADAGAPTDQLKSSVEQIIKVLEDPALKTDARAADRRAAIRKEAEGVFDFGETAKRALGRHWQNLSEKDRQEFTGLFADLIERAYISKIERYSGERIAYAGEAVDGGLATVRTRFVTKQGTEVPIDYRMQQRGDRWLVYDVSVEGVSLINNYRTQFDKIIQTSSYAELVRKMKAAELSAPASPRS